MRRALDAACLLVFAALAAAEAREPALFINLRVRAEEPAGLVRLGQIAAVTSEDLQLARLAQGTPITSTPLPGSQETIDRQTIAERLCERGIPPDRLGWGGAPAVALMTRSVCVTSTALANEARRYVLAALPAGQTGGDWAVSQPPPDRHLAAGENPPVLSALPTGIAPGAQTVRVFVRILIDGETRTTVPVVLERVTRKAFVAAARDIPRGKVIDPADVALRTVAQTSPEVAPRACARLDQVIGKVAARGFAAGQPISPHHIANPVLVRRGEPITINLVNGSLEVTSIGMALNDGRLDDVINVRVADTSKVIQATVKSQGIVAVNL